MEKEIIEHGFSFNRRRFLSTMSLGIGSVALGSLLMPDLLKGGGLEEEGLAPGIPHFAPKAKRVIYLFQNGAPSQQELFDYKPKLREMFGKEIPPSVRGTQRLTGMTANQASFPLVGWVPPWASRSSAPNTSWWRAAPCRMRPCSAPGADCPTPRCCPPTRWRAEPNC